MILRGKLNGSTSILSSSGDALSGLARLLGRAAARDFFDKSQSDVPGASTADFTTTKTTGTADISTNSMER